MWFKENRSWVENRQSYDAGETWIEVRKGESGEEQRHVVATPWRAREPRESRLTPELIQATETVLSLAAYQCLKDTPETEMAYYIAGAAERFPEVPADALADLVDHTLSVFKERLSGVVVKLKEKESVD